MSGENEKMSFVSKPQKTAEELHNLIIQELRKNPEFNLVKPGKPYWHETDNNGCNWDISIWQGDVTDATEARNFLTPYILKLRISFDIINKKF